MYRFTADQSKHERVRLDAKALEHAKALGDRRWKYCLERGQGDKHGADQQQAKQRHFNVQGAIGETGFAVWSGLPWPTSVGTYKTVPDFPQLNAEIRGLSGLNYGLIVRDDDPPDRRYVLAIVQPPVVIVAGWRFGHEARRLGVREDLGGRRAPTWVIPQQRLRRNGELLALLDSDPYARMVKDSEIPW